MREDTEAQCDLVRSLSVLDQCDRRAQRMLGVRRVERRQHVARSISTADRRRRVERMRGAGSGPGNVVLVGDAACCFNPIYAQGMTAAALGAELLGTCLDDAPDPARIAPRYHRRLAAVSRRCWTVATTGDLRVPGVSGAHTSPPQRLTAQYLDRALAAATHDEHVQLAFLRVLNMLAPPTALLAPQTAVRVVAPRGAGRREQARLARVEPPGPLPAARAAPAA